MDHNQPHNIRSQNGAKSQTLPILYGEQTSQSEPCSPVDRNTPDSESLSHVLPFSSPVSPSKRPEKSTSESKKSHWFKLPLGSSSKKKKKAKKNTNINEANKKPYMPFAIIDRSRRQQSVMEEDITLKTLPRRDRNSVVIRKSLALDVEDTVSVDNLGDPVDASSFSTSVEDQISPSSLTSASKGRMERGRGHLFRPEWNQAMPLWCDICGDPIISLLYQAIRCQHCGYLCHESCRPGVGLDCPWELEQQSLTDEELQLSVSVGSESEEASVVGDTYSSSAVSEHINEATERSTSSISNSSLVTTTHSKLEHDSETINNPAVANPVESPQEEFYTIKEASAYEVELKRQGIAKEGPVSSEATESETGPREKQVQKWAIRLHRSNTLLSKNSAVQRRSSTLQQKKSSQQSDTLVGSAAGPKLSADPIGTDADSIVSPTSHSTLPSKLKSKDLEKMVADYAKHNPHSDLKIVKKPMSKELSKSKESIFSSSSKKKDQVNQLEFEGFLHVTMCLHRPISVANEVALDFSLESVGKNMSFERSKSENRTTFYLPYGSEHAVRCNSSDSTLRVIKKLLEKFHVADDPRKYVLFDDTTSPDGSVTRRKVKEDEKPLCVVLLRGSTTADRTKHSFVLEENEQPDIQVTKINI
ncbi:uncharacterized protein LOC142334698 isoform X1 [Convolutriloba macropyga]|uniref:uncharacterized protein LOC142334698 isoform X1 n=1 Tax=Convolutriloba macropyga TaxID=536237 RepID=UPI003F524DBF